MTLRMSNLIIPLGLLVLPISLNAQVQGRGTGTCSQLINGKYQQVPCTYQNPQPQNPPSTQPTPSVPSQEELDRQAREREAERLRKERERKQQEEALRKAEDEAKQRDFIQRRDDAVRELKDIDSTKFAIKEIAESSPKPCSTSQNAMIVDACDPGTDLPKGIADAIEGVFKDSPRAVTDRVRKGFNAVMQRDWKLASVWLRDALAREPNNVPLRVFSLLVERDKEPPDLPPASDAEIQKLFDEVLASAPTRRRNVSKVNDSRSLIEDAIYSLPKKLPVTSPTKRDLDLLFFPDEYVKTSLGTRRPLEYMVNSKGVAVPVPADYLGATDTYIRLTGKSDLVPVPSMNDLNLLFPGAFSPAPRSKVSIYRMDDSGKLIELPKDYEGSETIYVISSNGKPFKVERNAERDLVLPLPKTRAVPMRRKQER